MNVSSVEVALEKSLTTLQLQNFAAVGKTVDWTCVMLCSTCFMKYNATVIDGWSSFQSSEVHMKEYINGAENLCAKVLLNVPAR